MLDLSTLYKYLAYAMVQIIQCQDRMQLQEIFLYNNTFQEWYLVLKFKKVSKTFLLCIANLLFCSEKNKHHPYIGSLLLPNRKTGLMA